MGYFETFKLKAVSVLPLCLQLSVDDLQATIKYMHDNKKYKKVRFNNAFVVVFFKEILYMWLNR